jgi:Mg2+/citrate symporter
VSAVGLVFAASVLTGVLQGTGMVDAMAQWLVSIIPASFGPHLPIVAGLLSLPLTFFRSNDAFFFGVLPVLSEAASHYGIAANQMTRAAIIGRPLHTSSSLVASFLLLVGLARSSSVTTSARRSGGRPSPGWRCSRSARSSAPTHLTSVRTRSRGTLMVADPDRAILGR